MSGIDRPRSTSPLVTLLLLATACTTAPAQQPAGAATAAMPAPAPDRTSSVNARDLSDRVVIRRTAFGVPHILADDLEAAGYGMAWVQLEDYGDDVVDGLLRARGEWARVQGPDAIDSDAAARLRYRRAVETFHQLEPATRQVLRGFAAGVNRFIELRPEAVPDWAEPTFTPYDVHARSVQSASLGDVRDFMERLEEQREQREAREATAAPESTVWSRLAARWEDPHPDVGSNAWALAPHRTSSGNAMLLRNPHLSWDAGYYEAHVTVPGVLNFYGDFRLGGPFGIIGGFNERLGWATTNNYPDLDEIYAFQVDPERVDHILLDGASIPLRRETVTVEFRNGPGLGQETREFLFSPFGPVFHREGGKVYVLMASNHGNFQRGEQFLRMMRAENLEQWKEAMRLQAHPSSNLTYADADGNIFYVWNARTPLLPHASGGDTAAVAVATTEEVATRLVDWDSLPQLLNPAGGYLHQENDEFHYTALDAIFDPGDFPDHWSEPRLRLRSQHSIQLIGGTDQLSLEEFVERKHSMRMLLADRVKEDLVAAVRASRPTGEVAEAIDLIEGWDNTVARDSRGGLLFKTWWWRYVETGEEADDTPASGGFDATPESLWAEAWDPDRPVETPRGLADPDRAVDAFLWAIDEAKERYGGWDLPWGEVHRAKIGDVDVPVGGCTGALGCFRVLWFVDHEEDPERLQVRGGDGWVLAVEFAEPHPRAYSILAYGQSDRPERPFYNDQLRLFADNGMKPVAFTEAAIREGLIQEYRPGR